MFRFSVTQPEFVVLSHSLLPPLISPQVDQYAYQPCLFVRQSAGNGAGRTRRSQEGLLNQVQRVVSV